MAYGDGWQDPRDDINKRNSAYGPLGGDNTRNRMANRQFALRGGGGAAGQKKTGPINEAGINNLSPSPGYAAGQDAVSSALPASNEVIMNRQPAQTPIFQPVVANRRIEDNPAFSRTPVRDNPWVPAREQGPIELPYTGSAPLPAPGARTDFETPGEVNLNRNEIAEARPIQRAIESGGGPQQGSPEVEEIVLGDYSNRVSRALQQMGRDNQRNMAYSDIRAKFTPPPDPRATASAELNQGGLFRRIGRRFAEGGLGFLKGLAMGGPGGAIAGTILGATGDIYRHDRTAQLIDEYARQRQAGEDMLTVQKQQDAAENAEEKAFNYNERSEIMADRNRINYELGQTKNELGKSKQALAERKQDEVERGNLVKEEQQWELIGDKQMRTIQYIRDVDGRMKQVMESEDGGQFVVDKERRTVVPLEGSKENKIVKGNPTTARIAAGRFGLAQNADARAAEEAARKRRKEDEEDIKTKKSANVKERLYNEELTKQAKSYGFVDEAGNGDPSKIPDALRADLENDARDASDERWKKEGYETKVSDRAKRRAAGEPSRKEREKEKKTKTGPVPTPGPPATNPFQTGMAGAINQTGNIFGESRKRPGL